VPCSFNQLINNCDFTFQIFHTGSEQFNIHPGKGVEFLQSQGMLAVPLDPNEVASFLRENPSLDKRVIGDYIANRKYSDILHAFVLSFDFANIRIDEALRVFLESFRLPGEAVPISLILEEFAAHWSNVNGNPFANVDAAYILAYQVIMLNVDQHNTNVKKQAMTLDGLKANLKGTNGGQDFDPEMLKEIYNSIRYISHLVLLYKNFIICLFFQNRTDEILLPSEHVGQVKENYLWKMLLRRALSPNCKYQSPAGDEGVYDHDLFSLAWGSIVAALSFIFDKTSDSPTIIKSLNGFRKCATIAAHVSN
jgi:brefeldin A-resistance guanine nucleotide exchange factor 1